MTKFLEGLKGLAAVLASLSALYVAQLYLTPPQIGFALIFIAIVGLSWKVERLIKLTSPTLNTNEQFRKRFFDGGPVAPKHVLPQAGDLVHPRQ
jgi:hypothetical protein